VIELDNLHSSGIEEVDSQHREMNKLLRRLKILQEKGSPKELVLRILKEGMKYVEYHFASEENLMLVIKYPELGHHELEHEKLLRSLKYKLKAYQDDLESLASIMSFLTNWFLSHTQEEDTKIGVYLKSQSQMASEPKENG